MLRLLILRTAVEMDKVTAQAVTAGEAPWVAVEKQLSHKIGMCNYYANRLVCSAADRAIQIHGGDGYSRQLPLGAYLALFQTLPDHGRQRGGSDAQCCCVPVWI